LVSLSLRKVAITPWEKVDMLHVATLGQRPSQNWATTEPLAWRPQRNCWHPSLLSVRTSGKILHLSITVDCKFWGARRRESCSR
jgi:hypothetical protein